MIETSIVIPSYRRPGLLVRALNRCLAQQGVDSPFEIVVVDNDPAGSAAPVVAEIAKSAAVPVRYALEARPGISHARNTGVATASGRYLVFLDDDEEPVPGWLAAFVATMRQTGADLAVGPVYPEFAVTSADAYRRRKYTRDAGVPTGTRLVRWSGIGNTILDKARCFAGDQPFDPALGLTGGEDTVFLHQLLQAGRKLVWCAEAAVHETVPADRLDPQYLLRRAFRGGQGVTFMCTAVNPPQPLRAVRMMAVGGAQLVVYGAAALTLRLLHRGDWLPLMDKAAAGLGKLLWHPRLHIQLYRRTATPPPAAA
ncbi:MAG TPA: glycosyltransferase family 2 protein [Stellaceae bacterium]|jgi:succinoglycan biosynthesis protein ExoM|nr:glycosyltransferase family 2 protein [Stellaceae bacterium]